MRNHIERLVVLPFSFKCASHSSVELGGSKIDSNESIVSSNFSSLAIYTYLFMFIKLSLILRWLELYV